MKSFLAILAICLLLSPAPVFAQTRSRRTAQRRRPPSPSATSRLSSTELNVGRIRVADQIKNLTRFIYLYGRFSKDLELTGQQREAAEVTNRTKASLINNLRNVRDGLDGLEAQFRLSSSLARFYPALRGVASRAAEAENKASANQFDQAGRALIEVVNQLTDVLSDMS